MRAGAIALCCLLYGGAAAAEDDIGAAAKGALCSLVEDSLTRLVCFDKAFPRAATPAAANESTPGAPPDDLPSNAAASDDAPAAVAWSVETSKSAIDDSPTVFAVLLPVNQSGTGVGQADAALIMRCSENTTSMILSTNMFIAEDYAQVTVRVGDAPAKKMSWARSTNYKSVGLWRGGEAIPFIKTLTDNTKFVARIEARDRVDAEFNLANVSDVVGQVSAACGWSATTVPTAKSAGKPAELGIQ